MGRSEVMYVKDAEVAHRARVDRVGKFVADSTKFETGRHVLRNVSTYVCWSSVSPAVMPRILGGFWMLMFAEVHWCANP